MEQILHVFPDLGAFASDFFDVTLCLGGALSYVREARDRALNELIRVTKPGGLLIISVMSLAGTLRLAAPYDAAEFLTNLPDHLE